MRDDVDTEQAIRLADYAEGFGTQSDLLRATAALRAAAKELDATRAERDRLADWLRTYGGHTAECGHGSPAVDEPLWALVCTCGWAEVAQELGQ